MTHAQEYLRTRAFADLAREHGVYATLSANRRKASLSYDQIEAKESDLLASQCRGLILARHDFAELCIDAPMGESIVLARPFDRFFNHGQHGADAGTMVGRHGTRVVEKLDGTLCILHFDDYQGAWHVATRSVPEADTAISGAAGFAGAGVTFRGLFDRALAESHGTDFDAFVFGRDRETTYLFELTTPFNQVVVRHERCSLWFLGARHRSGREFLCPDGGVAYPVPHAPSYPCETIADLFAMVNARPPTESEGVVVVDANFRRVKVKSAAYVAAHGLRDSVASSPRRMMELILLGQEDDAFAILPAAIREGGDAMRDRYADTARRMDAAYARIVGEAAGDNPRKAMALAIQRDGLPLAPMMARYGGKCDGFRSWVATQQNPDGSWPDSFLDKLMAMCAEDGK